MPNPRLASRYAKSLIDIATEQGLLEKVFEDMQFLQSVNANNREFTALLRSPIVAADKKEKIIAAVTEGRVTPLTTLFIKLLISKSRESNLPEILTAFIAQYKAIKNIHVVKLTTAAPVSDGVKVSIVAQIRKTSNMQNIELESKVDPSLIGGFTLQSGDKLIDASVAYDLKQISKQFENNDFIYKVR